MASLRNAPSPTGDRAKVAGDGLASASTEYGSHPSLHVDAIGDALADCLAAVLRARKKGGANNEQLLEESDLTEGGKDVARSSSLGGDVTTGLLEKADPERPTHGQP